MFFCMNKYSFMIEVKKAKYVIYGIDNQNLQVNVIKVGMHAKQKIL